MTVDIEKLKALALAATPGPWAMATDWDRAAVYSETHMVPRYKDSPINKRVVCSGNQNNLGRYAQEHWSGADWHDAAYIAAANPAAVLDLIAEVERLRAELAARCRAEGGDTSNGGIGSDGAAGTVKDAERWRAFRARDDLDDLDFTSFQDQFCGDADAVIDAAIEDRNSAGKD